MLTINQAVGLVIAISLTVMLMMIGYQILQILQEVREGMRKVNKILDDSHRVVDSVAEPVVAFSGFIRGLKNGSQMLSFFQGFRESSGSKNKKG